MAGLTQAQAADLAKLSSDLLFILQEAHVSLPNQAQIGHLDVVSVPLFAGLDETRVKVQEALAPPLDVEGNAANRLEMAKLLVAWEGCKTSSRGHAAQPGGGSSWDATAPGSAFGASSHESSGGKSSRDPS